MQIDVTYTGRAAITTALAQGTTVALSKVYFCTAIYDPATSSGMPDDSIVKSVQNVTGIITTDINRIQLEVTIPNTGTSDVIKNITISSANNGMEQNFAISNDSDGLFTLNANSTTTVSLVLQIEGNATSSISVNTNIQFPMASSTSVGSVCLANDNDVLNRNNLRDNMPLVISPAQIPGPRVIDYIFGSILLSQDASNDMTGLLNYQMDSSTASIVLDDANARLEFDSTITIPNDLTCFYEFTISSATDDVAGFVKFSENATLNYSEFRDHGIPSSGIGNSAFYVKIICYVFPIETNQ